MIKDIYKSVFDHSPTGYAYHQIIVDQDGNPSDYRFLEVNPAYEKMVGLKASYIVGKTITGIISMDEEVLERIRVFGDIALNGGTVEFDQYSEYLNYWFHVSVYSPEKGYFIACCSEISDKKTFHRELQKKPSELDAFFDVSLDLLCIFDLKGNLKKLNKSWFETLGYSEDELKDTTNYLELVHPDDRKVSIGMLQEIKDKGRISNFRNRCKAKKGDYRWFEWQSNIHGDFIYATAHDITQRIYSETKLRESEEKFRLIFENTPIGLLHYNKNGEITECNDNFVKIIGSDRKTLIGLNMHQLPDKRVTETLTAALHDLQTINLEINYESFSAKKSTPVRLLFTPILSEDGTAAIGGIGIIEDISERVDAEKNLRESKEKYQSLFEQAADGVLIISESGIVTDANKRISTISGYTKDELVGNNISILFPKSELKSKPLDYVSVLKGKTVFSQRNLVGKDGVVVIAEMNTKKVADGRLQIYIRDITEQYLLKEKLRHSEKMEAIGQLAGGIAHDFNNMLAGIMGGASLLETYVDSGKGKKYLKLINDSAQRTSELTKKLLAFGRKGDIEFGVESINTAVKNAVEILHYTLDKKIDIDYHFESEIIRVEGSLTQLQNVFINLGINAGHAMPDGGMLRFKTRVVEIDENCCRTSSFDLIPGRYAEIEVADTGTGITAEHQQKIFEPFFTTKKQNQGTGLGLATVYGTVKDHKGVIDFESEEGKGTVFHIFIPLIENKQSRTHQHADSIQYGTGSILLVEDEKIVRETSQDILEVLGYTVLVAENGKVGVDLFNAQKETIDLVIVDMIMPKMNGKECFKEIMQIDPSAKIILASGFSNTEDVADLKAAGLMGYIKKPFQIAELSRIIKGCLKR